MAIPDKSKYTNRILASDIEAKGFLDVVNTPDDVWCIVSRDLETDEFFLFSDYPEFDNVVVVDNEVEYTIPKRTGNLQEGVTFWELASNNGSTLSIHNMATYDKPLINKIWPQNTIKDSAWFDTFIWSKIAYFDRPQRKGAKSPHGLLNYSLMQGMPKPKVEDFSVINAYMMHRACIDTVTQKYCHQYLEAEHKKLNNIGIDLWEAYAIEVEYAGNAHKQEVRGVKADVPHMERYVKEWDIVTDKLASEIEPLLPPTVKPAGAKVPRSDLMKALGWPENKIPPDELESVTRAGETKIQPVKPYVKPSVNFHKTEKVNNYSGFNISYGESPTYIKKTELTKWIKANHPDTKPKDWDIEKTVLETKVLNANCCQYFGVAPEDTDLICGPHTRVAFNKSGMTQHEVVKGYLIRYAGLRSVEEWNIKKSSDGQLVRAEFDTVVSYPPKAAPEHQMHYSVKKREVLVTSPKLGEKDYSQLVGDIGEKIGEYNTTMHRRRYLSNVKDPEHKGLLAYVREDGRLPAGINNFGTSTGRSTHRVIVNLPSESALLGKEMRSCLIAEAGKVIVGADMASAQLQICALVTNNTEYYEAVAKGKEFVEDDKGQARYIGTSAHCVNARSFQLISQEQWRLAIDTQDPDLIQELGLLRKQAKPPAFASLFGCAPPKLALMLGITVAEAKVKLESFLSALGLDVVQAWLKVCQKKYKRGQGFYIPSAFGYWVYCKSTHSSVNYLIQSVEGAVQKVAVNYFENEVAKRGWCGKVEKVLDMHDEFLVEADPELAKEAGRLMGESYTYAGTEMFNWYNNNTEKYSGGNKLNVHPDFDGGHAIGESYYDCH